MQTHDAPDKDSKYHIKFKELAKKFNYETPCGMLNDWYNNEEAPMDIHKIRERLKIGWDPLKWAFKRYGIKHRPFKAKKRKDIKDEDVIKYLENHTQMEAAKYFKCTQGLISQIKNKHRGINTTTSKYKELYKDEIESEPERIHETWRDDQGPPIEVEFDLEGWKATKGKRHPCYFCTGLNQHKKNETCDNCEYPQIYLKIVDCGYHPETVGDSFGITNAILPRID